ncbi:cation diffusion facilitator family transporter [Rhodospirillum sp. A1_3_36]|uniref:cation diffusion facilitator family transporter n=1 Tax=Rhodospirillum sp. A1_3_36 TaxID=3391666 RepID=UPI0039A70462
MASGKGAILKALIANMGIAAAKLGGASVTGSAAMFSEGVHSLVDSGNQGLLLLGMSRSEKAPDEHHPLGYGKETYFWSFLVAMLIFGLGATVSFYEGVEKVLHPHAMESANFALLGLSISFRDLVLGILVLSILLEGWSLIAAWNVFKVQRAGRGVFQALRDTRDPTVLVVLFEDSAAVLGLVIAFIGVFLAYSLDMPVLDGVASICIGVILAVVSVFLAIKCKALLIGEAADPATRAGMAAIVADLPGVVAVNEIITLFMGADDMLVLVSVDYRESMDSGQIEAVSTEAEKRLRRAFPLVFRVFVEAQGSRSHKRLLEHP